MAILLKAWKPDNFEMHISLKLSFTNIWGLHSNFADCESFLKSNSPDIFTLSEINLDDSIGCGNFSVRGYLPLIRKDSSTYVWSCSLCERTSFCMGLIFRKLCRFLCFQLALLHSVSYFFFLFISFFLAFVFVHGFFILFHLSSEVLLINPSANAFVFGDFNVHHKDLWW